MTTEPYVHFCTRMMACVVRLNQTIAGWDERGCYVLACIEPGANIPFYQMIDTAPKDRQARVRCASAYCEHDGIAWIHGTMDDVPFAIGFQHEAAREALAAALGSGRLILALAPEFKADGPSFSYGKHIEMYLTDPMLQYAHEVGMHVAVSPH